MEATVQVADWTTFYTTIGEPEKSSYSSAVEATIEAAVETAIETSVSTADKAAYLDSNNLSIYYTDGTAVIAAARVSNQTTNFATKLAAEYNAFQATFQPTINKSFIKPH